VRSWVVDWFAREICRVPIYLFSLHASFFPLYQQELTQYFGREVKGCSKIFPFGFTTVGLNYLVVRLWTNLKTGFMCSGAFSLSNQKLARIVAGTALKRLAAMLICLMSGVVHIVI
jgi:hypothetical protein